MAVRLGRGGLQSYSPDATIPSALRKKPQPTSGLSIKPDEQTTTKTKSGSSKNLPQSNLENETQPATVQVIAPSPKPEPTINPNILKRFELTKPLGDEGLIGMKYGVVDKGTSQNLVPTIKTPQFMAGPYVEKTQTGTLKDSKGRAVPYVEYTYVEPQIGKANTRKATPEEIKEYQASEQALSLETGTASARDISKVQLEFKKATQEVLLTVEPIVKTVRDARTGSSKAVKDILNVNEKDLARQEKKVIQSTAFLKEQADILGKTITTKTGSRALGSSLAFLGKVGAETGGLVSGFVGTQAKKTLDDPLKELAFKPVALAGTGYLFGSVASATPLVVREFAGQSAGYFTQGLLGAGGFVLGGTYAIDKVTQIATAKNVFERGGVVGDIVIETSLLGAGAKTGSKTAQDFFGRRVKIVPERALKDPLAIISSKDAKTLNINVKVETKPPRLKIESSKFRETILRKQPIVLERLSPQYKQIKNLEPLSIESLQKGESYLAGTSKSGMKTGRVINLQSVSGKSKAININEKQLGRLDTSLLRLAQGGKSKFAILTPEATYSKSLTLTKNIGKISRGRLDLYSKIIDVPVKAGKSIRLTPGKGTDKILSRSISEIDKAFVEGTGIKISRGRAGSVSVKEDFSGWTTSAKKGQKVDLFVIERTTLPPETPLGKRYGVGIKKTSFSALDSQQIQKVTEQLPKLPKPSKSGLSTKTIPSPQSTQGVGLSVFTGTGQYERSEGMGRLSYSSVPSSSFGSIGGLGLIEGNFEEEADKIKEDVFISGGGKTKTGGGGRERVDDVQKIDVIPFIDTTPQQDQSIQQRLRTGQLFIPFSGGPNPFIPTPEIIKEKQPKTPKLPKPSKGLSLGGGRYTVLTRRYGKFKTIGVTSDLKKAFAIGRKNVLSTLGATFTIKGGKDISGIPSGFYKKYSKKYGTLFIQKRKTRISSAGEKAELRRARRLLR